MAVFRRYFKWFLFTAFFFGAAIFHASFVSALPPFFSAINLSLILLFFILLFVDFKTALIASVILGFCLDVFTFSFFGFNLLSFLFSILVVNFLLVNWLTNRSLYPFLALSAIGTLVYNFSLYILLFFWQGEQAEDSFFLFNSSFWISLSRQIVWSLIFMILFFNLANSLSKRLKPFFLEKK